ncbi:MAG: MATE family efflux transporter [Gammaproteobacteria bacterium]|nr:MAG: MATE family efflux transporter [Pseudomonadota bacterium]PIE38795.1 MAG: MATE family efflux transporter [Gammaproteobacteria bacterium]
MPQKENTLSPAKTALATTSLAKELYQKTWPMLFGVFTLMSFHLADSAFIGQLGVAPLATVGFTLPIYQVIIGVQVGLGIATTAIISRAIGAKQHNQANRTGGLIVLCGAIIIMALCSFTWWFRHGILALLGAEEGLVPLIDEYWPVWLISAWCGAMLYFGYSICRAHGNTLLPGTMMTATGLLNIALDPLFIFVFDLGISGAAWATLTCFCLGGVIVYPKIWRHQWLSFDFARLNLKNTLLELSHVMGPAMLSQLMPSVSAIVATGIVATWGTTAVAAWGLGIRLEYFSIVVVLAMTMSIPPILGKLFGAGDSRQIEQVLKISIRFILVWQLAIYLIWLAISPALTGILTTETAVAEDLQYYIATVPLSYGALGVCMLLVSACNAIGMPFWGLCISFTRLFACYLPFLWVGSQINDFYGLITGAMVGNFVAGWMAWNIYSRQSR